MEVSFQNVVCLDNEKNPTFSHHVLCNIFIECKAFERPVCVISITGEFRAGKSFFLNLFATYLHHLCKKKSDAGWEDEKATPIVGGRWAGGQKSVTAGIWMWMYPELINEKLVLLVDCQGTGDNQKSTPTLDNLILFLGLQISDVIILNINKLISSNDLLRLNVCAHYARDECDKVLFEHLLFLVRNWEDDEEPHQLTDMVGSGEAATKDSIVGILKAFKSTHVSAIPHPGKGIVKKKETDGITIGSADEDFLLGMKEVFRRLIKHTIGETKFTGYDLLDQFQILAARPVDVVKGPEEEFEDMLVRKAFTEAKLALEKILAQIIDRRQTVRSLELKIDVAFNDILKMFLTDVRIKNHAGEAEKLEYAGYLSDMRLEFTSALRDEVLMAELVGKLQAMKASSNYDRRETSELSSDMRQLSEKVDKSFNTFDPNATISILHVKRLLRMVKRKFKNK